MLSFYEMRRGLEASIFPALQDAGFNALWLGNANRDWQISTKHIRAFLHAHVDLS